MKTKVSDLIGMDLDYWVAKAKQLSRTDKGDLEQFSFSSDWTEGGPIIESEEISIYPNYYRDSSGLFDGWAAASNKKTGFYSPRTITKRGDSPLIAAMRVFVASRFGETVDTVDEAD